MKIAFAGTPDFAAGVLTEILKHSFSVAGVITGPDKPAGRGQKLISPPVKTVAEAHHLPVLQPVKLRDPAFLEAFASWNADLLIVVAFRMMPQVLWEMPPLGTFNLHASLLPDYRGAAPINWAIANGETETGVTTFFLAQEIDTGNLLLQKKVPILPHWNAGDLHDELMTVGAGLVVETILGIENQTIRPVPQDEQKAIHKAPRFNREMLQIHWNQPTETIHHWIRAFAPNPGAWTVIAGKQIKILSSVPAGFEIAGDPGEIRQIQQQWYVKTGDGWLQLGLVKLEGKAQMNASDLFRGWKPEVWKMETNAL